MLQITIYHYNNGTHRINQIDDDNSVITQFDEESKKIDLDVCKPYIGQKITVQHIREEKDGQLCLDYINTAVLDDVNVDDNGLCYIQYHPDSKGE